ncbi:hypothetical protein F4775DRAFT_597085 [Biscogniauxia sp. FL1348]|nr:hypothetical protein F4775DRAFT_597085 [Biscogniauxia sp. FL1348]
MSIYSIKMQFHLSAALTALLSAAPVYSMPVNVTEHGVSYPANSTVNAASQQDSTTISSGDFSVTTIDLSNYGTAGMNHTKIRPFPLDDAISLEKSSNAIVPRHEYVPHKGVIPITYYKCTGEAMDEDDYAEVTDRIIHWGKVRGNIIKRQSLFNMSYRSATWNFCNCKWFHDDPLPENEIEEVRDFLEDRCGPNYSGWVYSKDWDKGYTVLLTADIADKDSLDLCPKSCFYGHAPPGHGEGGGEAA